MEPKNQSDDTAERETLLEAFSIAAGTSRLIPERRHLEALYASQQRVAELYRKLLKEVEDDISTLVEEE
jgi:hypothetical protein